MARTASGMGKELKLFKFANIFSLSPTKELPGAADERCFGIWSFALSVPGGYKRLQKQRRGDTDER